MPCGAFDVFYPIPERKKRAWEAVKEMHDHHEAEMARLETQIAQLSRKVFELEEANGRLREFIAEKALGK